MKVREGEAIMDILFKMTSLQDRRYEMDKVADVLSKMGIDFKVNYGRGFIEIFSSWKIWFISYEKYYIWSKGRTYYSAPGGEFYHSGIPMKDDEIRLNMARRVNSRDYFFPKAISKFLQTEIERREVCYEES